MRQTIASGGQMWVNVADLIHNQAPDRAGKALPPGLSTGSYEVRDLGAGPGSLLASSLAPDQTLGPQVSPQLPTCCGIGNARFDPSFFDVEIDGMWDPFLSVATDQCSGSTVDISGDMTGWWSSNVGIAKVNPGKVQGVAPGSTFVNGETDPVYVGEGTNCVLEYLSPTAPVTVQVPTCLQVLNVAVLTTGTGGNNGCTPSGDYGIEVDVKYQVLDQNTAPISNAIMVPHEHVVYTTGQVVDGNICPSRNSNCTPTTASDGTWHDVPYGACGDIRFSLGFAQSITIILGGVSYPVRT